MSTRSLNKLVLLAGEALLHSAESTLASATDSIRRFDPKAEAERSEFFRAALQELDASFRELEAEKEIACKTSVDLQRQLDELKARMQTLQAENAVLRIKEEELRRLLVEAHHQLLHRDEEIQATLVHALRCAGRPLPSECSPEGSKEITDRKPEANKSSENGVPSKHLEYQEVIRNLRKAVERVLPTDATVLVVSKGDEELLSLEKRKGWHFPQAENGGYAGYYPKDSAEAIAHLEKLRERGASHILFPGSSLWWLDYYAEFKKHLAGRYHCVHQDQNCVIYSLVPQPAGWWRRLFHKLPNSTATSRATNS